MPDLSKCVKDRKGNIWCWDLESESVLLVKMEKPAVGKIPQEVLLELLKETAKERKAIRSLGAELDDFV
jgi:hypothetical protein